MIDRRDNMANAIKIVKILGIDKKDVIKEIDKNLLVDVTILIGKDYYKLRAM